LPPVRLIRFGGANQCVTPIPAFIRVHPVGADADLSTPVVRRRAERQYPFHCGRRNHGASRHGTRTCPARLRSPRFGPLSTRWGSRVFHASSAIRTFWIAVSFVNGGSGGLGSIKSCGETDRLFRRRQSGVDRVNRAGRRAPGALATLGGRAVEHSAGGLYQGRRQGTVGTVECEILQQGTG
jgi:hypothetical protein